MAYTEYTQLGRFMTAYIDAIEWTGSWTYGEGDSPHEGWEDDHQIYTDCVDFLARANIQDADLTEIAGHDFWLTRQGHGAGFWDRPEVYGKSQAERLTQLAETFGEYDL